MKRLLLILGIFLCCFTTAEPTQPSKSIAQQGHFAVEQLITPSFDQLNHKRKQFVKILSQAMHVSRDIFWIQGSREGLAIRELLSRLWAFASEYTPADRTALSEYFFRILMEHRNYDRFTNSKIIPQKMTPEVFARLVAHASVHLPEIRVEAERLRRDIFDPDYRAVFLANPPLDRVALSNSNYYQEGVTESDILRLQAQGRMDAMSHVVFERGEAKVEHPRIGGLFSEYLKAADYYLKKSLAFATKDEAKFIEALRAAFRTGLESDWKKAFAAWLANKPTDLDFMLGFIEKYEDPLGERTSWEGWIVILAKDPNTQARVEAIRSHASEFELEMPVDHEYKKTAAFIPPNAEGNDILFASGRTGEQPFLGKNLFEDPELKLIGNKSFTNLNLVEDLTAGSQKFTRYLEFLPERYHKSAARIDLGLLKKVQVEFHEILGHGSGQSRPGVGAANLQELYNPLEEARAELASLYHLTGDRPYDLKILKVNSEDERRSIQEMAVVTFFTDHIISFFRLGESTTAFRQAHQWARHLMLNFLVHERCLVIEAGRIPQVVVRDIALCHQKIGELWLSVQTAKSTGDYGLAKGLFSEYGSMRDGQKAWRKQVLDELERQQRPKYKVTLNPRFDDCEGGVRLGYRCASPDGVVEFINEQVADFVATSRHIKEILHQDCEGQLMPRQKKSN